MKYPLYVEKVIDLLEEKGYSAYAVGGCVRDYFMGRTPDDYDVTTSAKPDEVLSVFAKFRTIPTGIKHGTVTVLSDNHPIEITTFRIDGDYKDKRHPESVKFTSKIEDDLSRRDFTVNAMAYSYKRGLADPFGGKKDIGRKIIKAVGNPMLRFDEDALRIMRAFRFASQFDFEIEGNTLSAIKALKDGLSGIARERIQVEFLKLICSQSPEKSINLMIDTGVFPYIAGSYTPSPKVVLSLKDVPATQRCRMGLLLCECEDEKCKEILESLKLSSKLKKDSYRISRALTKEMRGGEVEARRFLNLYGDLAKDIISCGKTLLLTDESFELFVTEAMEKKICTNIEGLCINGSDIVKIGIKGKNVGLTVNMLLESVIINPEYNTREKLLDLAEKFKQNNYKGGF